MKICKKIRKIINIRLKNFSTKNQKSILADTHKKKQAINNNYKHNYKCRKKIIKNLKYRSVLNIFDY